MASEIHPDVSGASAESDLADLAALSEIVANTWGGGWTKAWLAREKEKGLIQALDVRRFKERVCEKLFQWPSSSHLCSKHLLQRVATFSLTCSTIAVLMRQPNAIVPGGDMPFIRFTSVHFGSTHSFLANKRWWWWWWWWRWWWWRWWWGVVVAAD